MTLCPLARGCLAVLLLNSAWLQAQEQAGPREIPSVRPALETHFTKLDKALVSSGRIGPEGSFFLSGDLTSRRQVALVSSQATRNAGRVGLEAVSSALAIDSEEYSFKEQRASTDKEGAIHYRYHVFLENWPIENFELNIHAEQDGRVFAANGNIVRFTPDQIYTMRQTILGQSLITEQRAREEALRSLGNPITELVESGRMIEPHTPNLVFFVSVATKDPVAAWRILIDASTGEVVSRHNQMQNVRK